MIATCPACAKRYRIPDDAIPPEGRSVRCSACAHMWTEHLPEPDPAPRLPLADPAPRVTARPPVEAPVQSAAQAEWTPGPDAPVARRWPLVVAALVAVAVAALAVIEFAPASTFSPPRLGLPQLNLPQLDLPRIDLPRIELPAIDLPPLDLTRIPLVGERLNALVHPLPAPPSPLTIAASGERRRLATGGALLVLSGTITNPTDIAQAVAAIDARLVDPAGRIAYRWRIAPPVATLPAHHSVRFDSTAANYPANAERLDLGFVTG